MSRYLLDTELVAAYLLGRPGAVARITPIIGAGDAVTSQLVYGEMAEYLMGMQDYSARRAQLRTLMRGVPPQRLTYRTLELYAEIRRTMRPPHGPGLIGDIDTLIAASARERSLTVLTADSHFARVPALSYQLLSRADLRNP